MVVIFHLPLAAQNTFKPGLKKDSVTDVVLKIQNNKSNSRKVKSPSRAGSAKKNAGNSDLPIPTLTSGETDIIPFEINTKFQPDAVTGATIDWVDIDNDGQLDLMLTGTAQSEGKSDIARIYRIDSIEFSTIKPLSRQGKNRFLGVDWGDFDLDGDLDVFVAGGGSSDLHLNASSTTQIKFNAKSIETNLPLHVVNGATEWGDYDQDGDLDLLIAGSNKEEDRNDTSYTKILENIGTTLKMTTDSFIGVSRGSANWGDYDQDGDLDFIISGVEKDFVNGPYTSAIYQNNNGKFDLAQRLAPIYLSTTDWGDYNNDGYLDILLAGKPSYRDSVAILKVYKYDPSSLEFVEVLLPGATGTYTFGSESAQWGDIDNDGRLDVIAIEIDGLVAYLNKGNNSFERQIISNAVFYSGQNVLACADYDNDGDLDVAVAVKDNKDIRTTWILENKLNGSKRNKRPQAPGDLRHSVSGSNITFTWDQATDDLTPSNGLSYDIIVYKKDQNGNVTSYFTPSVAIKDGDYNGIRKIVKRGMINSISKDGKVSYSLKGLKDGTYYWSVQSVDHGFAGSAFAEEKSFFVGPQIVSSPKWYKLPNDNALELAVSGINEQNTVQSIFSYAGLSEDFGNAKTVNINVADGGNINLPLKPQDLQDLDPIGIQYRFKFVNKDNQETEIGGVTYWEYSNDKVTFTETGWHDIGQKKKTEQVLGDYNLISLPFEAQPVTALGLETNSTDKWRLYHYDSEIQDFEEYSSSSSNLEPRRGYALIMREGDSIRFGGRIAELNGTQAEIPSHHTLVLQPKWNLIGNPYPFDIEWSKDVIEDSTAQIGELVRLGNNDYDYNGGSTILKAFEGVFIYNYEERNVTVNLLPNIKPTPNGRISSAKPEKVSGWEVLLGVENRGYEYKRGGIGMKKDASEGLDIYDGVQLPKLGNYAELLMDAETEVAINRSIIPEQNSYVWKAEVVGSEVGEQITLHWDQANVASLEQELYLWDETRGKLIAMKEQNRYSFVIPEKNSCSPLKFYYGAKEGLLQSLDLEQIQIGTLFPNPTEGQLKLPVLLPVAGAPYKILMKVFDSQGRQISSFARENLEAGYQELELNFPEGLGRGLFHYTLLLEGSETKVSSSGRILKK